MGEFGSENFHERDPNEEMYFATPDQESGGIGLDRPTNNRESRDKAKRLGEVSLALFLIYQSLPGESANAYGQNRPREATAQSQETRRKLATGEMRERRTGVKSLEQLYQEILTDEVERDFYQTNLDAPSNYVELHDKATDNVVYLNRELVPIQPGVQQINIAHTHVGRSHPPSAEDFVASVYDYDFFRERNIAVASQTIEQAGLWTLKVNRNNQTHKLKDYALREDSLNRTLLAPNASLAVRENLDILNDPSRKEEFIKLNNIEGDIQEKLKQEFPEVAKDITQMRQIYMSIVDATERNKDPQDIDVLVKLYQSLVRKYGIELSFEPRKSPQIQNR